MNLLSTRYTRCNFTKHHRLFSWNPLYIFSLSIYSQQPSRLA